MIKTGNINVMKIPVLFVLSVFAQGTDNFYIYFVSVILFSFAPICNLMRNNMFGITNKIIVFLCFGSGLVITAGGLLSGKVTLQNFLTLVSMICIILMMYYLYHSETDSFCSSIRTVSNIILASAVYGIVEYIFSYNIMEKFFVADYIRGYYGTENYRIASIYMHPITCGHVFLIGYWLVDYCYKGKYKFIFKLVYIYAIFCTKSRSIWGGLFFSLVFELGMVIVQFFRRKRIQKKYIIISLVTIIVFAGLFRAGLFDNMISVGLARFIEISGSNSEIVRTTHGQYVLSYMFTKASPLRKAIGFGYSASRDWIDAARLTSVAYGAIDNMYLTLFYEFGVISLVGMVVMYFKAFKLYICNAFRNQSKFLKSMTMLTISGMVPLGFYDGYGWYEVILLLGCSFAVFIDDRKTRELMESDGGT